MEQGEHQQSDFVRHHGEINQCRQERAECESRLMSEIEDLEIETERLRDEFISLRGQMLSK